MTNQLTSFKSLDTEAGVNISQISTLDEILQQARFDFEVEQTPVFTPEGEEVPNKQLIRRADNKHVLGVVGSKYTSIDTRTMLEPFHDLVTMHGAMYESAGLIRGGQMCWISATLPSSFVVPGREKDKIQQRIVCSVNHGGVGKNAYFSLANRLFCNNQIRLITKSANKSDYGFRHTKNWEDNFTQAAEGFKEAIESMIDFETAAAQLNNTPMKEDEIAIFMKRLYRMDLAKPLTPRGERKADKLKHLFKSGAGNIGETRWDALNAVTELLDHHSNRRFKTPSLKQRARERRFVSNNLSGYGDSLKQRALKLLLNTEKKFG